MQRKSLLAHLSRRRTVPIWLPFDPNGSEKNRPYLAHLGRRRTVPIWLTLVWFFEVCLGVGVGVEGEEFFLSVAVEGDKGYHAGVIGAGSKGR